MSKLPAGERESVTALERGFSVLHCFGAGTGALTHLEITRACGLPKATVSRIIQSLVKLGYLAGPGDDGRYRLTARNLLLGRSYLATVDFRATARPLMAQLAHGTRTTVNLSVREGDALVVVETVRSDEAIVSVNSRIGLQFPILQTAMGRAWLGGLPPEERDSVLENLRPTVAAHEWNAMQKRVRKGIAECDDRGFCCLTGEWRAGVNSVAAPLRLGAGDQQLYVINCAGPDLHLPAALMAREVGPQLLAITEEIRISLKDTWT